MTASRTPDLAEVIRMAMDNRLANVHVALPGRVESYDVSNQSADIKPLIRNVIQAADGGDINEELAVIPQVPIVFPRAGGYFVSFPIQKGDLVTLIFCERSIDKYSQEKERADDPKWRVTDPTDYRMHDVSDAVAFPGFYPFSGALADAHASNMVMGKDGGAQIHIKSDEVNLYEENANQFVALAQKVLDELTAAKNDRIANKGIFDAHTHTTTATIDAGLLGVLAAPATGFPAQTAPSSVAATKVKAT